MKSGAAVTYGGEPPSLAAPVRENDAPPEIAHVWLSQSSAHWGDVIRIRVVASTNASIVEVHQFSYGRPLRKRDFGQFTGILRVPLLPPLIDPPYTDRVRIIARNSGGKSAEAEAVIALH